MSYENKINHAGMATKRTVKRPTLAGVAAVRFTRQMVSSCICSHDGAECQAPMCVAQQFARKCGLDAGNEHDYKIMIQLCDAYHEGYYAGFDAGHEYAVAFAKPANKCGGPS